MNGAQNVLLIGGPGTGKTHVATAIGVQAIRGGCANLNSLDKWIFRATAA
jgi:DNA replication protein DnaC